jgi:hypothetical protein
VFTTVSSEKYISTKIGFSSMPLAGHLNPMTALARKLQSRGHEIVLIGVPDAGPTIRAAGLNFVRLLRRGVPPPGPFLTRQDVSPFPFRGKSWMVGHSSSPILAPSRRTSLSSTGLLRSSYSSAPLSASSTPGSTLRSSRLSTVLGARHEVPCPEGATGLSPGFQPWEPSK